jgi:hypothetical protein
MSDCKNSWGRLATHPLRSLATAAALLAAATAAPASLALTTSTAAAFDRPFIGQFATLSPVGSTVPANGDVNPYGVAIVPRSQGALVRGDVLVSNFNNEANEQGTGSTIVQVAPTGALSLFAHLAAKSLPEPCPGGLGLTTALAILPGGYVVVGSLPTGNGKSETMQAGCLIVLNSSGEAVKTISGAPINGPWDMTATGNGVNSTLFVTNVLNGTVEHGETPTDGGTVVRIRLHTGNGRRALEVTSIETIAEGFPERTDEAALVVGPTGVGLDGGGTLYVADTQQSRIAAIPNAMFRTTPLGGGGETVAQGGYLNAPLGLAVAPNGDILTVNGDDGNLVETTPVGAEFQPFNTGFGEGALFGLAVAPRREGVYLVDDANNTLALLH